MKYRDEDLRQLQEVLYVILGEIVRVCKVLDIPYFIQGGSAIGAHFNQGIVPWDDDIDVGMLRSDYERFLREAPAVLGGDYFLECFQTEANTPFYFTKVKKNNTLLVEKQYRDMPVHHGIFVDIFPYDRIPDNAVLEKIHRELSKFWINAFQGKEVWAWKYFGKCRFDEPLPKSRVSCFLLKTVTVCLSRKMIYSIMNGVLGMFNGCDTKRVNIVRMPRDQFFLENIKNAEEVPFGPLRVMLPANIEVYLNHHYPNLRPVLPVEEQINHAPYKLSFNTEENE